MMSSLQLKELCMMLFERLGAKKLEVVDSSTKLWLNVPKVL